MCGGIYILKYEFWFVVCMYGKVWCCFIQGEGEPQFGPVKWGKGEGG